jgi:hypothetical protein
VTEIFNPTIITHQYIDQKITSSNKIKLLNSMVYLGQFHAMEAIVVKNAEKPYNTVDEVIGDMQIYMLEVHKYLEKEHGIKLSKMTIQNLIDNKNNLEKTLRSKHVE